MIRLGVLDVLSMFKSFDRIVRSSPKPFLTVLTLAISTRTQLPLPEQAGWKRPNRP